MYSDYNLIKESSLTNIGDSIRDVLNENNTYSPAEMANVIDARMLGVPDPIVAGDYPIYGMTTSSKINSSSYTDLGVYRFTVNRAGTYRFKWCMMKAAVSFGSGTTKSALFLNDVQQYENTSFSDNVQYNSVDVACNVGDVVSVRGLYSGSMYAGYIYGVHVCIDWSDANAFFV